MDKRQAGRFYTQGNPFEHDAFEHWADRANLSNNVILEPFAGANGLIHHLEDMGLCTDFRSFDIQPGSSEVRRLDTLARFPRGFGVCVTNPPWLARNVATRYGLPFPDCQYQDIYAHALERCLENCDWVAALVPESFLRAGILRSRLSDFVSLTRAMFEDTDHPVGLALFDKEQVKDTVVWSGEEPVGGLSKIEKMRPLPDTDGRMVRFNDPRGNVGLLALDNTKAASIRFCHPSEIEDYKIDSTRRSITRILVEGRVRIAEWNEALAEFREKTCDVLMTPFRGLREDGKYRRRCDWQLARGIIHDCAA